MTHESQPSSDTFDDATSPDAPASETEPTTGTEDETESQSETQTEARTETAPTATEDTSGAEQHLLQQEAAMDFRARWEAIQQGFVDDPRSAVTDADALVSDVLEKLSATFDEQHGQLEAQWNDGEPDTEDLRSALRKYRDFFDRLLTI